MSRRLGHKGKVDKNQAAIVQGLRKVGAKVQSIAEVGDGCPDLLVGFRGTWYAIEVKMPGEALTEDEAEWWDDAELAYCGCFIVYGVEDALKKIGAI